MIDQSLRRLKLERLDLVQFHWWDYAVPRWLEAAQWLDELQRAGKIDKVGAHQFRHRRACWHMVESGVPLTSMQVQYSLLDSPAAPSAWSRRRRQDGVSLFCYGTVAGGFLGDRWLGAAGAGSRTSRTAR